MTSAMDEAGLRTAIQQAVAQNDAPLARNLLAQLWRSRPGPALASFVVAQHERLRVDRQAATRLFLLRSCTFEPVVPVLRAQAFVNGLDLEVQVGDFNSYAQEILKADSPLYRSEPAVVVLAVHTADVAPELWEGFSELQQGAGAQIAARVTADFRSWVRTFRERSQAHLIVHGLELPITPSCGVLDTQGTDGQVEAIQRINRGLREIASEHKGVYVLDYDALIARHGRMAWHDSRKWMTMRVPLRAERMHALAQEWLRFLHPITGKVCKVLVVDLDNTLWGGVIGEDGMTGIKVGKDYPGPSFLALQRAILDLHRRGVLLAVCSKNNAADALEALEHHPEMLLRPNHFAALRINWDDKAQNLRSIAKELNLGIDALAFIDDNPAERALVAAHAPEVTVIELPEDALGYAQALRDSPVFERLSLSAEDRERGRYYAEERQRNELQAGATSLEDFYRSLDIAVSVSTVTPETLARTSQLTQKTNQFNLTTRRYSEQQLAAMAEDPSYRVYTVNTADRFGDNGLVGVAIVKLTGTTCEIDTLLLSCRVIGRTIETALLSIVASEAYARGATQIAGKFIATKKNAPSREFFPTHGFICVEETEVESQWTLDLNAKLPSCPPWIACRVTGNGTAI